MVSKKQSSKLKISHLLSVLFMFVLTSLLIIMYRFYHVHNKSNLIDSKYSNLLNNMRTKLRHSTLSAKKMIFKALVKYTPYHSPIYNISPRIGTDILSNPEELLQCHNQSTCIIPELTLIKKYNIYICMKGVNRGYRFILLVTEGLQNHPNVHLVNQDHMHEADFFIYLPASSLWEDSECGNANYKNKLIVLDEFDGHTLYYPISKEYVKQTFGSMKWYFIYFKRSFCSRKDGKFQSYPKIFKHEFYPITYSIANSYIRPEFQHNRSINILCTLRGNPTTQTTRLRIQQWVSEYVKKYNIPHTITNEINAAGRETISSNYFENLYNSKIIVTVNPKNWEGDFRLWESLASGALVLVDHLFVPYPHSLIDCKHVVFYNNSQQKDLEQKLDYYHNNPRVAEKIARNGYLYALKYHRTVSMIDYILSSTHVKVAQHNGEVEAQYRYTAQNIVRRVKENFDQIISSGQPEVFADDSAY